MRFRKTAGRSSALILAATGDIAVYVEQVGSPLQFVRHSGRTAEALRSTAVGVTPIGGQSAILHASLTGRSAPDILPA